MKIPYNNPDSSWKYNGEDDPFPNAGKGCLYSISIIIACLIFLLLLSGCKSVQYVPVEKVKTEYVSKTDTFIQKDFVYLKDSIFVESKNDTVVIHKWHTSFKDRFIEKTITDTVIKVDSIQVPYPVEKKLSTWQSLKIDIGGFAITACLILMVSFIILWLVKMGK